MKKILLIIFLLICNIAIFGQLVTQKEAESAAINFFKNQIDAYQVQISRIIPYNNKTTICYYAVILKDNNWVIIAGDKRIEPILAYSINHTWNDNSNPAFDWWMSEYEIYVLNEINENKKDSNIILQWEILLGNSNMQPDNLIKGVEPLFLSNWGQTESNDHNGLACYNYYAPSNNYCSTGKCAAGCVAVAIGQIMKYWNYPPCPNLLWQNMPDEIISTNVNYNYQREAVSYLLNLIGLTAELDYCLDNDCSTGSSNTNNFLNTFHQFNYNYSITKIKKNYSIKEWKDLLRNELNNNRPIYYQGCSGNGCHAFVINGWKENFWGDFFYFNWGWLGNKNGWYRINRHDYANNETAIINIIPAIDCNSSIAIKQYFKFDPILNVYYYYPQAGIISTYDNINIENGETVIYHGYNTITLNTEFTVNAGANFTAKIVNCPLNCNFISSDKFANPNTISMDAKICNFDFNTESFIVELFPNPCVNECFLTIKSPDLQNIYYSIIDIFGNPIIYKTAAKNQNRLDFSNFPKGIYFLNLFNTSNFKSYKIFKQ